jgi:hypothetical protein
MNASTKTVHTERPPATADGRISGAEVDLDFLEGQLNYRLLFGRPEFIHSREHTFGITKCTAVFKPRDRFGLDLWEGRVVLSRSRESVIRTGLWRVLILEVGVPGERVSRVPQVRPGAHVLMDARGVRCCKWLLRWLAELETQGDLADLPRECFLSRDLWFRGVVPERTAPAALGWPRRGPRG